MVTSGTLSLDTWVFSVLTYMMVMIKSDYIWTEVFSGRISRRWLFSETNNIRFGATRVLVGTQASKRWVGG